MIRVLVCDDQEYVREGLRAILRDAEDIEVVGTAEDGDEAVELVPSLRPNVVLMDLKMPLADGVTATRRIRDRYPEVRVLVLTTYDADEWVFDAVRSGAAGYLLKDAPRDRLMGAIRDVAAGRHPVDPGVAGKLLGAVAKAGSEAPTDAARELNRRELEVLRLLARGLTNADIAERLSLSKGTVRNYVSSTYEKLGVADRTQAAVLAIRYGLVDLNES